MKVSFIGLGVMGGGMAMNLGTKSKGEFEFVAINPSDEVLAPYAAEGFTTAKDNIVAAEGDVTFLCLPTGEIVKNVLFGENGLAAKMKPGHIVVDCSTIGYKDAVEVHDKLAALGIGFLDAPISGHHAKAVAGTLTIMVGGEEELFKQLKPMFDKMGTTVQYMGVVGGGQLAKMINNCVFDVCIASFCELMPVAVKMGLKPEAIGEILMNGASSSYASKSLIPEILQGNFEYGFSLERAYKDILYMYEITDHDCIPLPTFDGMVQTYKKAMLAGYGKEYKGAMIKVYEEMLGVKCRKEA